MKKKIRDLWLCHTRRPLPVPLHLLGSSTGQLGWQGWSVYHWNTNGDVVCTRSISALKGYVIITPCLSSCQQCSPSQCVSGVNYCSCTACEDHWPHWRKNAKYYSSLSVGGWAEFPSRATTVEGGFGGEQSKSRKTKLEALSSSWIKTHNSTEIPLN